MVRVAILGTGNVGQAIAKGLLRAKHEIRFGSRNPAKARVQPGTHATSLQESAAWGEIVVVAVPFHAVKETVRAVSPDSLKGKVLVDATNVIGPSGDLAVGLTTSGAEELAKLAPGARVVKAFNTVLAQNMATGKIGSEQLTFFAAGDDRAAKEAVLALGRDIGFDPVDAGPLRSARYLEPMAMEQITLAYGLKMGPSIGIRLVRGQA